MILSFAKERKDSEEGNTSSRGAQILAATPDSRGEKENAIIFRKRKGREAVKH